MRSLLQAILGYSAPHKHLLRIVRANYLVQCKISATLAGNLPRLGGVWRAVIYPCLGGFSSSYWASYAYLGTKAFQVLCVPATWS